MTVTENPNNLKDGRVVAIAGPVVDVEFPRGSLPEINTALEMTLTVEGVDTIVVSEVAQQIGDSRVRVVTMKPTDGLRRGTPVRNTGRGITVPVGEAVSAGKSTAKRRRSTPLSPSRRSSRPVSRSSTFSPRTSQAARSACSVVPVWARPFSSRK
jgi:hypothetical protein